MLRHPAVSILLVLLLCISLAFSVDCGSDNKSTTTTNQNPGTMAVKTVTPAAAATCTDPSTKIQVTFSMAANTATVSDKSIQVIDGSKNAVAGTVSYDASSNAATFTPSAALSSNASYTINVSGVSSSTGVVMASPFSSTFTTGPCSNGQAQYQASLFNAIQEDADHGQVSVDSAGAVTTNLTGAAASTTFKLQFCPAPLQNYSCFDVGDITTDASGNANVTESFPKAGSWAGDFHVNSGTTTQFVTDVVPNASSQVYSATLVPATTANGNGVFLNGPAPGPQDPLSSGTVAMNNGMVEFKLNGASPGTAYSSSECPVYFGSSCYGLYDKNNQTAFTSDSSGNLSFSVVQDGVPGDIFQVSPPSGRTGFVGGFKVP